MKISKKSVLLNTIYMIAKMFILLHRQNSFRQKNSESYYCLKLEYFIEIVNFEESWLSRKLLTSDGEMAAREQIRPTTCSEVARDRLQLFT